MKTGLEPSLPPASKPSEPRSYDRQALASYLRECKERREKRTFTCPTEADANRLRWALNRTRTRLGLTGVGISQGVCEVHLVPYIDPGVSK